MKNTYIIRQAILNENSDTIGYELLFKESQQLSKLSEIDHNDKNSISIIENQLPSEIKTISQGKLSFINFTENCLLHKLPLMFDKSTLVIELVDIAKPTNRLCELVRFYHELGFIIALTQYDLSPHWDVLFPFINIVKVDIEKINTKRLIPAVIRMRSFDIEIAAEKVENRNQQQTLAEVGFDYFQGSFYHQTEMIVGQTWAPIKSEVFNLLSDTLSSPLNYDNVVDIISHDVNLTVGLLKMINNADTDVNITSVKQATEYLGKEKLKQFISILALSNLITEIT